MSGHDLEQLQWANIPTEQAQYTANLWAKKYKTKELRAFQMLYEDLAAKSTSELDHKSYDNRWKILTSAISIKEFGIPMYF